MSFVSAASFLLTFLTYSSDLSSAWLMGPFDKEQNIRSGVSRLRSSWVGAKSLCQETENFDLPTVNSYRDITVIGRVAVESNITLVPVNGRRQSGGRYYNTRHNTLSRFLDEFYSWSQTPRPGQCIFLRTSTATDSTIYHELVGFDCSEKYGSSYCVEFDSPREQL